jgi:hypothetical protein
MRPILVSNLGLPILDGVPGLGPTLGTRPTAGLSFEQLALVVATVHSAKTGRESARLPPHDER